MQGSATIRKTVTAMLVLAIALWAEAGLALITGDQVMQCSMTMHHSRAMAMPCCPDEALQAPAATSHPECCSNGDAPERPLGFVVSSKLATPQPLNAFETVANVNPQATRHFGIWRSADAPRFVKSVLELKTDLRI